MDRQARVTLLKSELANRILVLDGGTGTALQNENLTAQDFGGEGYEGCNEILVLTKPEAIKRLHLGYLDAGADIVETDTFGATPLVLAEYNIADKTYEINKIAASIARQACEERSTKERPRFVAGSIGPTTKAISITGGITFDQLAEHYYQQVLGLYDGGVDYFFIDQEVSAGYFATRRSPDDLPDIRLIAHGTKNANPHTTDPIARSGAGVGRYGGIESFQSMSCGSSMVFRIAAATRRCPSDDKCKRSEASMRGSPKTSCEFASMTVAPCNAATRITFSLNGPNL
jgi:hypothetical protein